MPATGAVARYVRIETIVSIVINAVVSALFVWIVFRGMDMIPLWGSRGMAADLVPTTFMITLMTTIAMTLVTRKRLRAGNAPRLAGPPGRLVLAWLPRNVLLRGLTLAIIASLVLVPLSVAVLMTLRVSSAPYASVMLFKVLYGAALAALISPSIVLRALLDPTPAR